ncbi:acyl carrier protein [Thalassotalea insulae]|uniref:[acyl-carrier-protein] S-malonyltransferase n=1 Tax=Thalassotalea insulae TaxID=2056778 RepID=A0ABQ6GPL5_9GAMM|nr:ACP S-malonyltransferase [Thalassotalea insulae]GLX77816.1 acyl carrier protein [Thalassotalea insulae]
MTNTKKQRAVVICPGRGTYNKEELGYLSRFHSDKSSFIEHIDQYRTLQNQAPISKLDSMDKYSMRTHTAGENASALIYACAYGDYQSIDNDKYDIVAVTGNSMGWYIALAVAGALKAYGAIELINTMGSMMTDGIIGGQLIYPVVDQYWQRDKQREQQVLALVTEVNQRADCQVYISIYLGGYIVLGGDKNGLQAMQENLPVIDDRYPMNLFNHAAFHTPLLNEISSKAQQMLAPSLFHCPDVPLIDGLGNIWQPYATDCQALYDYTLGTQVVAPYNFSKAIEVAVKEFAPDKLIILGPGATLGGSVAQCLIEHQWQGLNCKTDFIERQKQDPYILSMGIAEQRALVI